MNEIIDFLAKCQTFYMSTIDENGQPKVRPFGFVMEWNGKPAFSTGSFKKVYNQLQNNPNIELCGYLSDSMQWMRVSGMVKFTDDLAAKRKILEVMPFLKELYKSEDNPALACFYIDEGEAAFYAMATMGEPTKVIKI